MSVKNLWRSFVTGEPEDVLDRGPYEKILREEFGRVTVNPTRGLDRLEYGHGYIMTFMPEPRFNVLTISRDGVMHMRCGQDRIAHHQRDMAAQMILGEMADTAKSEPLDQSRHYYMGLDTNHTGLILGKNWDEGEKILYQVREIESPEHILDGEIQASRIVYDDTMVLFGVSKSLGRGPSRARHYAIRKLPEDRPLYDYTANVRLENGAQIPDYTPVDF